MMQELSTTTNQVVFKAPSLLLLFGSFLFLLIAIFWPLASIWALNILFELTIPYTFWTWLAAWILILTFQGIINISRKSNK